MRKTPDLASQGLSRRKVKTPKSIGLICQYSPPEVAPIGVMLSELAHDLAQAGHHVTIFTGFPNHPGGMLFPGYRCQLTGQEEQRLDGVVVRRNWLYISPSKSIASRVLNYGSFAISTLFSAIAKRHDVYLIVSPPLTNIVIGFMLRLAGRRYVLNVQDIYPDAAVATGLLQNRFVVRALHRLERLAYQLAYRVTVISNGFVRNLVAKGVRPEKITLIPNWIDPDEIQPQPQVNAFSRQYGLDNQFTILYSGTIGIVSGAEIVLDMASNVAHDSGIVVMMVGEGVVKARIEEEARMRELTNMRFAPFQSRESLADVLSSASVGLVTLLPGHGGNSVPSKILGYLAAGRPVIASVDPDSDTWEFIQEARCGLCVPPGDAIALTLAVLQLRDDRQLADQLGANGRAYLVSHLQRSDITAKYEEALCN